MKHYRQRHFSASENIPFYCDLCTDDQLEADYSGIAFCEDDFYVEYGYRINLNRMNYTSAFDFCKRSKMLMVTINNDLINKRVYDLALKHYTGRYWINGNDNAKEGNWVDSENNPLLYKNWKRTEPNGGRIENCINGLFYGNSEWNDYSCELCNVAICENPKPKTQNVEYGYHINQNRMNYNSAINYCKKLNMLLVTINNDLINKRVYDIALKYNVGWYWINGNDNAKEGNWVDSENNPLLYKNWKRAKPNGDRSNNCIHGLFFGSSEWNDYNCNLVNSVICEDAPEIQNVEFGYHINRNKMNYNSAINYCKKLNMLLVTINNDLENKHVYDIAVKYNIGWYWINRNDNAKEGNWVYSENNPLLYKNWKRNEPNGGRIKNCIHGLLYGNSEWNDYPCNLVNSVICEKIPQIGLPVPTRIKIERKSGTEIHISWELPVLTEKNKAYTTIEGFIILYSPIEFSPKWLKHISQKSSLSANIKGLKENVKYQFKAAATNYAGDNGNFSESVEENDILPNSTLKAVQSLRCFVQDSKSLKVEWKSPSISTDLMFFKIKYSGNISYINDMGLKKSEFIVTESKILGYVTNVSSYDVLLDELHSNALYKISVNAIFQNKEEYDFNIEITCSTSSNVPDIVEAPIIVGLDKDKQEVMVKLHRCSQKNGKISNYFIIVGNMKTINKTQYPMKDPDLYTLNELIAHTKSNNSHGEYIAIRNDMNKIFQENGRNYSYIFLGDGAKEENYLTVNKKLKRHVYYGCFVRVCLQDSNNSLCKSSLWSHPFMINDMIHNRNNSYIFNQSLTSNKPKISNWILIMIFLVSAVIVAIVSIIAGFILKRKKSKEITMIFSKNDNLDLQLQ